MFGAKLTKISGIIGLLFVFAIQSHADKRSYVWTYEYQTLPGCAAEIEYYMTNELPDRSNPQLNKWNHWVELEAGITDRLDVALYQQFSQSNALVAADSGFQYDGYKLRARYRFSEKGSYFVNPLVYVEYIRNDDLSQPDVFEGKLILGKDIEKINISYNQIIEQQMAYGKKPENEYALGINYSVSPHATLGIESKGNFGDEAYYLGPTISFETPSFWIGLGWISGLNSNSQDAQTRMIIGVPF